MPRARLQRSSKIMRWGGKMPHPSWQTNYERGAGPVALKKVNKILRRKEVKDHITNDTAIILNGGSVINVSAITTGSLASNRDGNRIYGQSLAVRMLFEQPNNMVSNNTVGQLAPPTYIRIVIVKTKTRSSTFTGVANYFDFTGLALDKNILAGKDNGNWLKNKTLWDRTYTLEAMPLAVAANGFAGMRKMVTIKCRIPGVIEFDDASVTQNMGGIFVLVLASVDQSNTGNNLTWTLHSRMRYVES